MLKEIIDRTFDEQVQELTNLISYPSISGEDIRPGMPLGKGVHDALTYTLDLARRLGFSESRSLDGYCGVIDYGSGDEMMMIMAHLDVVPAGTGWNSDPFRAEIRNGRLYGRGTIDDKGPALSALYALYAVKEAGIPLNRKVRILLGCDEEKDWQCIGRYKQTEPDPDLAITPDGQYPLVHSEMAICQTKYIYRRSEPSAVEIHCGTAANVIPGEAHADFTFRPENPGFDLPDGVSVSFGERSIDVKGFGGHASTPHLAHNALLDLLDFLSAQPLSGEDLAVASALSALLGHDQHGEGFGIDVSDLSGKLTLSPDMLRWDSDSIELTLDCRCPFCLSKDDLLTKLDSALGAIGFERTYCKYSDGHFLDPDGFLCKTLMNIYSEYSGKQSQSISIGGGTYARAFANAVAFGAEPENEPAECHMPNESIGLENIRFNTLVLAEAIARLAGVKAVKQK